MGRTPDQKFWLTIGLSGLLALIGGVSSYFNALASIREQIQDTQNSYRHEAESKYATKEETNFIRQDLKELKDGISLANERLYEIQKSQVLVRLVSDRVAKLQDHLNVATSRIMRTSNSINNKVDEVKDVVDKKKKK
jgi:hypothetical protein